jgi:hypothetical protein
MIEDESSSSADARVLFPQPSSTTRELETMGLCSLSENSEESSSWALIIFSQGLQTRMLPGWPNRAPEMSKVHFESKI